MFQKFMNRSKGAISIFLVIVMVPMLMVSSVFVDMGRINLAKAMATSAGDLTLNTALTNYDAVLKDMYGLFATSQNMDEMMANLENYYIDAIEAAGIEKPAAEEYVDKIMNYLRTQTGTDDLMNVDVTGVEVSVPTGANLANPAVLKSQVVEFMKYRAPVSLGTGFLEALSSMKDLDKQSQLVEDKTAFYEKQGDIIKNLETAWREMQLYQCCYVDSHSFPTEDANHNMYITNQGKLLEETLKNKMGSMISDTICYLYYFEDYALNGCEIEYVDNDTPDDKKDDYWKIDGSKVTPDYSESKKATAENVRGALITALLAIKEVEKYADSDGQYYQLIQHIKNTDINSDLVRRVYAVAQFNKSSYAGAVKTMTKAMIQLYAAVENCSEPELLEDKYRVSNGQPMKDETATSTLKTLCITNIKAHLIDPVSKKSPYGNTVNTSHISTLLDMYSKLNDMHKADLQSVLAKKNEMSKTDSGLPYVINTTSEFYKMIEGRAQNLKNAMDALTSVKTALADPNSDYNKALKAWEGSADALSGQTLADNDVAEIKKIRDNIKVEDVGSLITHLETKKATMDSVLDKIKAYQYQGVEWRLITEGTTGYKKIRSMMIPEQKFAIENIMPVDANSYSQQIASVKGTLTGSKITKFWNDPNDPDLTKPTHRLFTYLYNNYYIEGLTASSTSGESKVDQGKQDLQSSKDDLEKSANKTGAEKESPHTDVSPNLKSYFEMKEGEERLPSLEWKETLEQIKNGTIEVDQDALTGSDTDVGSILGDLLDMIENGFTSIRDDLYVSEYIMNMFTYETFEAETAREVLKLNNNDTVEAWYTKGEDGTFTIKDKYKPCQEEAMTLTNVQLHPGSSYLYGSEVEYIVYGSTGGVIDHSVKVKGTIFLIRFALNSVYAFTDAEINSTTTAAATALFGVPPLTPLIPVAKVAMIIGLSIAESTWDLMELNSGNAVPLMKNSTTWQMKASSAAKKVAAKVANKVIDKAVDAGYNMLNDVLEKTDEELTAMINASEDSAENLAQGALDATVANLTTKANEIVQQAVTMCMQLNEELAFDAGYDKETESGSTTDKVAQIKNRLTIWMNESTANDSPLVKEVKQYALDTLTANDGAYISDIFNNIKNSAEGNTLKLPDGSELDPLQDALDTISEAVSGKVKLAVDTAGSKLNEMKNKMVTEIKGAAAKGADSLRKTLKQQAGNVLGSAEGQVGNNYVMANLLNWKYSDYLRLFLLIALITDDEAVMLRMADVIELNMQHKDKIYGVVETTTTERVSRLFGLIQYDKETTVLVGNDEAFKMSKAYTYVSLNVTLEVKPLLMKLPLMDNYAGDALNGNGWYQIQYSGMLGY